MPEAIDSPAGAFKSYHTSTQTTTAHSMVVVTPGVDFLARGGAFLAVAACFFIALGRIAELNHIILPSWALVFLTLSSGPVIIALRIIYIDLRDRRRAAAMGARIVPRASGQWIGNLDILKTMQYNWLFGYPADGLEELIEKRGPVVNLRILWSDLILTASPEHIKTMLATDFPNYVKGQRFQHTMGSMLGTGVFNSDGDMWKFHRSITRPVFTRDRISHFDLFDRHAEQVIMQMRRRMRAGFAVDFQDLMSRFTLDSASEFLFGSCVHSLSGAIPYPHNATFVPAQPISTADTFARAFLAAQEAIATREKFGWVWPLYEIMEDKTLEPMKVVNAYIEPIVEEAIRKKQSMPEDEKNVDSEYAEDETLLDHLVGITSDPKVVRDETLNIMIAGRDTTAATFTFVIYLLSLHPEVTVRLRSEILEKVGPNRRPNFDDIRDMKYLRAVINETLRLFPIVPFNVRESINATTWPSHDPTQKPLYIPAGTKTAYSVFMMHRRTDLWGPDAEEFDPDRFLDDRLKKYLVKNSFIFLPFNAGPRICLGQQFAYNEMSFMLIRLLQSFSSISLQMDAADPATLPPAQWAEGSGRKTREKVFPKIHLTMYAHGGLWVKMQEAQEVGN